MCVGDVWKGCSDGHLGFPLILGKNTGERPGYCLEYRAIWMSRIGN